MGGIVNMRNRINIRKNSIKRIVVVATFSMLCTGLWGCGMDSSNTAEISLNTPVLNESTVIEDSHFANQNQVTKSLEAELAKNPTLENAFVTVDPYGISPLTAVVIFTTDEPTQITVKTAGKDEYTSIEHTFKEFSKKHIIPVYGLYADADNMITVTAVTKEGKSVSKDFNVKTDVLPEDISKTSVKVKQPEKMKQGLTFVDCPHVNGNYMLAVDANGDIRWYLSEKKYNGSVMLTHLKNGNMLISNGEPIPNTYNNLPTVFEISPLGRVAAAYNVYGIHHDIRETKDGNLIFGASKEGRDSQNDYIVEVDRKTGKTLKSWDLKEIIPMTEYKANAPYSGGTSNWFHNNAIWYNEDKNEFLISGRHQNAVLKFDAESKQIKWILSKTIGENNEKLRQYLLKPMGDNFEYPTAQHAVMELPDGKIMLFDNTNFDITDNAGNLLQDRLYSRAVIYDIDESNMTVRQVWQYGKERGKDLYSSFISDVDWLGEDHYLFDFGGKYIADDGTVYDHMYTPKTVKNSSKRQSTIIELLNGEVIWEMDLLGNSNSNTYKAERKDIYAGL